MRGGQLIFSAEIELTPPRSKCKGISLLFYFSPLAQNAQNIFLKLMGGARRHV
jgi:hypothetical protein